jgi:hypothetical protein
MARACGCDLRAVLAGAIICWAVVEGVAVAQEGAEVTEDLGNSYRLARRTTTQGSIIETLLFDGQAVVTEIAVPTQDAGITAGTTGTGARTLASTANAPPIDAAAVSLGIGPGFGGTLLTGEIVDNYLVLHRTRASGPVTHEIFREGRKVGSVTEVGPLSPLIRTARAGGRNSFAFESTDDRFVVHLMQADGTRIHATTEHGRFSGQTVERLATVAAPPRSGAGVPLEPLLEAVGPPIGRSPEPQRLMRPHEPTVQIMVEEPAPQAISPLPETVPLPRAFPAARVRPAPGASPVQTAGPMPAGNLYRGTPELTTVAPIVRPKPTVTVSGPLSAGAAAVRAVAPAPAVNAPAAGPKPLVSSVSAPRPPAASPARSVPPTSAAPSAGSKPAAPAIATKPSAAAAAKPIVRGSATVAPAANQKPTLAIENARPPAAAAKPITPVARSSRPTPPDSLGQ